MRALGVLGAVAAVLAAYLLFFDHDPRQRPAGGGALVRFDRASVRRIAVARPGQPPFALVRAPDGGWRIQPDHGPADPAAVEDLVNALDQAESDRTADLAPAAAGLAPPRVTVSIEDARGVSEVRLGNPDASGSGVFLQVGEGGAVRVGPRRLLELAERPASALRDRRPAPAPHAVADAGVEPTRSPMALDFAHFDVRALRRIGPRGTLEARSPDGETWTSQPPADPRAIARLVRALGNLRAAEWLPQPPAGRPDLVLEVSVQPPGEPAAVAHTVEVWPGCVAETKSAGAFRVAQDLCDDLRLDPALAKQR